MVMSIEVSQMICQLSGRTIVMSKAVVIVFTAASL